MNEEYLKGLHGHLGITDDYSTWVNAVQGDEEYLKGLHGHLGITDDYQTWASAVWGKTTADSMESRLDSVVQFSQSESEETNQEQEVTTSEETETFDTSFPEDMISQSKTENVIPSGDGTLVIGGEEISVEDMEISELYDAYKQAGYISQADVSEVEATIEAQAKGDFSTVETIKAYANTLMKYGPASGMHSPIFDYMDRDEALFARQQKNKVDFLNALPEDKVTELKEYAFNRTEQISADNLNVFAQNKLLESKIKTVVSDLEQMSLSMEKIKEDGGVLPKEAADEYLKAYKEAVSLQTTYKENTNILESNTEDLGETWEELDLLKRNYGGLDYYQEKLRLSAAHIAGGLVQLQAMAGNPATLTPDVELMYTMQKYREQVAADEDMLRPAMSVEQINGLEDFGMWAGEQIANQLPILLTLTATGGTSGLVLLSSSTAGSKAGEMTDSNVKGETNFSAGNILLTSIGHGAAEYLSERVSLGILSKGNRVIKSALKGKKPGAKIPTPEYSSIRTGVSNYAKKTWGAAWQEGSSEWANTLAQNMLDIAAGAEDVNPFDGALDAFASGAFMGKAMQTVPSVVGMAIRPFTRKEISKKIKSNLEDLEALAYMLETQDLSEASQNIVKRKMQNIMTQSESMINETLGETSKVGSKGLQRILEIEKRAGILRKSVKEIENSDLPTETKTQIKAEAKAEVDALRKEKENILDGSKQDGEKSRVQQELEAAIQGGVEVEQGGKGTAEVQGENAEARDTDTDSEGVRTDKQGDTKLDDGKATQTTAAKPETVDVEPLKKRKRQLEEELVDIEDDATAEKMEAEIEQLNTQISEASKVATPVVDNSAKIQAKDDATNQDVTDEVSNIQTKLQEAGKQKELDTLGDKYFKILEDQAKKEESGQELDRYDKARKTRAFNKIAKLGKELGIDPMYYLENKGALPKESAPKKAAPKKAAPKKAAPKKAAPKKPAAEKIIESFEKHVKSKGVTWKSMFAMEGEVYNELYDMISNKEITEEEYEAFKRRLNKAKDNVETKIAENQYGKGSLMHKLSQEIQKLYKKHKDTKVKLEKEIDDVVDKIYSLNRQSLDVDNMSERLKELDTLNKKRESLQAKIDEAERKYQDATNTFDAIEGTISAYGAIAEGVDPRITILKKLEGFIKEFESTKNPTEQEKRFNAHNVEERNSIKNNLKDFPTKVPYKKKSLTQEDIESAFDLNPEQSEAAAIVSDIMIENMAAIEGISVEEMRKKIEFKKSNVAPDGSLKQDAESNVQPFYSLIGKAMSKLAKLQPSTPQVWVKKIVEEGGRGTKSESDLVKLETTLREYLEITNALKINKGKPKKTISYSEVLGVISETSNVDIRVIVKRSLTKPQLEAEERLWKRDGELEDKVEKLDEKIKKLKSELSESEMYTNPELAELTAQRAKAIVEVRKLFSHLKELNDQNVVYSSDSQYVLQGPEGGGRTEVIIALPYLDFKVMNEEHFQGVEDSIVGWTRNSVRVNPATNSKVLLIEEFQSDWAQNQRKYGVKGGPKQRELQRRESKYQKSAQYLETLVENYNDFLKKTFGQFAALRGYEKTFYGFLQKPLSPSDPMYTNFGFNHSFVANGLALPETMEFLAKVSEMQGRPATAKKLREAAKEAEYKISEMIGAQEMLNEDYIAIAEHMDYDSYFGKGAVAAHAEDIKEYTEFLKNMLSVGNLFSNVLTKIDPDFKDLAPNAIRIIYNNVTSIGALENFDSEVQRDGIQEGLAEMFEKEGFPNLKTHLDEVVSEVYNIIGAPIVSGIVTEYLEGTESNFMMFKERVYNPVEMPNPYAKNNAWIGLTFRKTLQMAIEQGLDQVAWTTGQQQSARWGQLEGKEKQGIEYFYNNMIPKEVLKEAKRYDKNAKVEVIDLDPSNKDNNLAVGKQLAITITPAMRMAIREGGVPLFQNGQSPQGAMSVKNGKYIVHAITNPNVTTPLHELAHVYEDYLTPEERQVVLGFAGKTQWDTETSEKFARGAEKYLSKGTVPNNPQLAEIFSKFKDWLTDIYNGITDSSIDIELNPAMEAIYEKMFTPQNKNRNVNKEVRKMLSEGKTAKEIFAEFTSKSERMQAKNILKRLIAQPKTPEEALKAARKSYNKAKAKAKAKKPKNIWKETIFNLAKYFTDKQYLPKRMLKKAGGDLVRDYMVASKGSPGYAKRLFDKAYNKIYRGLTKEQIDDLNKIILQRRFIAIDKNRAKRGLDPVTHSDFQNQETAELTLEGLREELGDKEFNELNKRATAYFSEFKNLLDMIEKAGIVNKEFRDSFFDVDYQPRLFLQFLQTQEQENSIQEMGAPTSTSLTSKQVQTMEKGSDEALVVDSMYLLGRSLNMRAKTVAMNRTTTKLAEFMKERLDYIKKTKKSISEGKLKGKELKKAKKDIKYFEELQRRVKLNPIIGFTESGNPKYRFKPEPGERIVSYYVNGVKHQMIMEETFYDQYNDNLKGVFTNSDVREKAAVLSGTALVKTIATGNNPAFFLTNFPRDLFFVASFSKEYGRRNGGVFGAYNPLSAISVLWDFGKSVYEIAAANNTKFKWLKDNGSFEKFVEYGGMLDFLHTQGEYKGTKGLKGLYNDKVGNRTKETLSLVGDALSLKPLQTYSEIGFRLAVFNKSLANSLRLSEYKDMKDVPADVLEEWYISAVASARSLTDFSQGGIYAKDLDAVVPYLNAGIQGTRSAVDAIAESPSDTLYRMLTTGFTLTAIPVAASAHLIAGANWGDDDEDMKGLSAGGQYLKALEGVSRYDRINYQIIFTGDKDERGEYKYVRIAKPHFVTPASILAHHLLEEYIRQDNNLSPAGEQKLIEDLSFAFEKNISPVEFNILGNTARTPLLKAALTYALGYDFYREQPLSYQKGKVAPEAEGFESRGVEDFYKAIGEYQQMSPARLKGAIESLITTPSTSAYVALAYGGADALFADKDLKGPAEIMGEALKKSVSGRLLKTTSEFNRRVDWDKRLKNEIVAKDVKNLKDRYRLKELAIQERDGKVTRGEVMDYLKKIGNDNLMQMKRLANVYKEMVANPKIDPNVADLKYRDDKERALILTEIFGEELLKKDTFAKDEKKLYEELLKNKILNKGTMYEYLKLIDKL